MASCCSSLRIIISSHFRPYHQSPFSSSSGLNVSAAAYNTSRRLALIQLGTGKFQNYSIYLPLFIFIYALFMFIQLGC